MRSSFRRSTPNSPWSPDLRRGARRHPRLNNAVDAKAVERLHDFLRTRQPEVVLVQLTSNSH